jgi:hypothetical protein
MLRKILAFGLIMSMPLFAFAQEAKVEKKPMPVQKTICYSISDIALRPA